MLNHLSATELAQQLHSRAVSAREVLDAHLVQIERAPLQRIVAGGRQQRVDGRFQALDLLQRGAEGLAFEPLIQSGPNAALPHATAGERIVQTGEVLLLDFGITLDGYNSDITRTFVVGQPAAEIKKIYELVKQANAAGRAAARPGATGQDVDRAARQVIADAGYGSYFTHRTGHGLGLEGHEPPYMVEGNTVSLEAGNTFTIESTHGAPGSPAVGEGVT